MMLNRSAIKTFSLFIILTALCRMIPLAQADEILLKDGRRIVSDKVWREKGFVRYRIPGGALGIREEKVDRIVVHNKPPDNASSETVVNLTEVLRRKMSPRNTIEDAVIASVSITTPAAVGSGFFISDNGHILTNKHIVRLDRRLLERYEKQYLDGKSAMDRLQKLIRSLKERIAGDDKFFSVTRIKIETLNGKKRFSSRAKANQHHRKKIELVNAYNARLPDYYDRQTKYRLLIRQHELQQPELDRLQTEYEKMQARSARSNLIEVILVDGQKYRARLVAVSPTYDVALLKLDGFLTPFINPANPKEIAAAAPVYAIGNPTGKLPNSVAAGFYIKSVSGGILSGHRGEFLQVDAKIYPGNSGGPLVDEKGRVLGINTLKELTRKFEGLGYALSIHVALKEFKRYLPSGYP